MYSNVTYTTKINEFYKNVKIIKSMQTHIHTVLC